MQVAEPWNPVLKLKQTQSDFARYCLYRNIVISCSQTLGSRDLGGSNKQAMHRLCRWEGAVSWFGCQ
jgi:hypothetical protein